MPKFSPETLIAVGEKSGAGYVGVRPPMPTEAIHLLAGACRFRIDEAKEVSHPDGDYTLIRAESDLESAQVLAGNLSFAVGLALDTVFVPTYEPVSLVDPSSSPFDERKDLSDLRT